MPQNGAISFRAIDKAGNVTPVITKEVTGNDPVKFFSNGSLQSDCKSAYHQAVGTADGYDTMRVFSGGTAIYTQVNNGGKVIIDSAGKIEYTTLNSGGEIEAYYEAIVNSTTVNAGGVFDIATLTSADNTVITSGGKVEVFGSTNNVTVQDGGALTIYYSGKAQNVNVQAGGSISVTGDISNLTLAENTSFSFDSSNAVFKGSLDCYLTTTMVNNLQKILPYCNQLSQIYLRVSDTTLKDGHYLLGEIYSTAPSIYLKSGSYYTQELYLGNTYYCDGWTYGVRMSNSKLFLDVKNYYSSYSSLDYNALKNYDSLAAGSEIDENDPNSDIMKGLLA